MEQIGFTDAFISHKPAGKAKYKDQLPVMDHTAGINLYTLPAFLAGAQTTVLPKFDEAAPFELDLPNWLPRVKGIWSVHGCAAHRIGVDEEPAN